MAITTGSCEGDEFHIGFFLCVKYKLCYIINETSYKIYLCLRNLRSRVCWLSSCVCRRISSARCTLVHRNSYAVIIYVCKSSLELRFVHLKLTKLKEDNTSCIFLAQHIACHTWHVTHAMLHMACYNTLHVTHCMLHNASACYISTYTFDVVLFQISCSSFCFVSAMTESGHVIPVGSCDPSWWNFRW